MPPYEKIGKKIARAGGSICFQCPGCDDVHIVAVDGSRGWTWNGDPDKPTISPSILVKTGRAVDPSFTWEPGDPPEICHSFVRDGRIELLSDCTHALAGQTVDLPDWPEAQK
jgi:hypothetical protein